uniref:Uncharacterized protein n=1 Tax=Anguilla anguilla TaxID=7936 RepID=A0A0E9SFS2_ANGAN
MITPLESIKHAHKSSSNASFTCVSPIILASHVHQHFEITLNNEPHGLVCF